jgi:PAS domain S-box-containing protein
MNTIPQFNNHQLVDILAYSPNPVAIYAGQELLIQNVNHVMLELWAKNKDITGLALENVLPELKESKVIAILKDVWQTGITFEGKDISTVVNKSGKLQTHFFDFSYKPLKNDKGEVYCILHTVNDVTERNINRIALQNAKKNETDLIKELAVNEELTATKKSLSKLNDELEKHIEYRTKQLAESESRLRYLLAQAPIAIAVLTGKDFIIETANSKILDAWGKSKKIIGKPLRNSLPELSGHYFFEILEEVFQSGKPFYGNEIKFLLKKNNKTEEVYANLVYQPFKNQDGFTTEIMLVANVVTEQVLSRKKVELAEEMMRFSVEAANVGTWFFDIKSRTFLGSPRFKQLYGYQENEQPGYLEYLSHVPTQYHNKINDEFENALKTGKRYELEHPINVKNENKTRWVRSLGKIYPDSCGHYSHFSGLVLDITEEKLDDLRKNDFIAMVSHELKTPLTTLKGYVQLLNTKVTEKDEKFRFNALNKIETQVNKMTEMINSFLNVSRLESSKINLNKRFFFLNDLIDDVTEEIELHASCNDLTITKDLKQVRVHADQEKINVVISNLISNAIKYSPLEKKIHIQCDLQENNALVSVKDEGMGIATADLEKLFERYFRVKNNQTRQISGFGIGLYLSYEIIERHHGKIWAESEIGKGATFYFSIPLNG